MKPIAFLSTLLAAALLLPASGLTAASYDTAEVTRLHNQVKIVRADNVPKDANVGEKIDRISSVTTGDQSRAELRFPDKSLTRLGANSRFTLRDGQRTIDLDEGVMLLQVPKRIGGAKVRTAAVTAAVTGTTVLFEYLPGGYIKLIVIEGEVDLYFNNKPSVFRTVKAGEMIIMKADADSIPEPVDIDLERLLKTSKLISGDEDWMPNYKEVADAVDEQKDKMESGELVGTTLYLPGRGTQVVLESNTRMDVVVPQNPTPGTNNPPGNNPSPNPNGGGSGGGTTPPGGLAPGVIPGTTVLNNSSNIQTNPHVTAFNSITGPNTLSQGSVYDGSTPFPSFAFGSNINLDLNPVEPRVQDYLTTAGTWAVFKFEDLLINGSPVFNIIENTNVILSSQGDVRLTQDDSFGPEAGEMSDYLDLDYTGINNLTLYSQNGSVTLGSDFYIYGSYINLAMIAAGPASDVNIHGSIYLNNGGSFISSSESESSFSTANNTFANYGNLLLSAGRDINITDTGSSDPIFVSAVEIDGQAGRDINIAAEVSTSGNTRLTARRHINITSSGILRALSHDPELLVKLETLEGDITVNDYSDSEGFQLSSSGTLELEALQGSIAINNSNIGANILKAQVHADAGWITIGNSYLSATDIMKLYAQGNNGGVRFEGGVILDSNNIVIAGKTVEITTGSVELSGSNPSLKIFTDNAEYNKVGKGEFRRGGNTYPVTHGSFDSRPAY